MSKRIIQITVHYIETQFSIIVLIRLYNIFTFFFVSNKKYINYNLKLA